MGSEHEENAATTQAPRDGSTPPLHSHTNKLIDSTSPYLLQHAHNPVDWFPWGAEALAKAQAEDKPIFLSIGYAACHWCHVMEREVFEKHDIASIMNAHFINIKVDREERPDLDELYMLATQIMSGSGGWPMSVWLTPPPGLKPFYAGTYFPPTDAYGRPGFPRLELALADAWKNKRADLEEQATRVVEAIRQHADETATEQDAPALSTEEVVAAGLEQLNDRVDDVHGGLGSAPKFPPHQPLQLWLALLASEEDNGKGKLRAGVSDEAVTRTLDAMMKGGIYDHVGGGFARYSTDERWLVPHFEKMLYDSAQLAPVYALASVVFNRQEYARIAGETLDFFLREMTYEGSAAGGTGGSGGGGAFFSSLDADSAGEEGLYYVWTIDDISAAVGNPADAQLLVEHFGMTPQGNWHESPVKGGNVLAIAVDADTLAQRHNVDPAAMRHRLDQLLLKLRTVRTARVRPGLDDKILTAWNGLMISALAITGRVLREPRYLEAAHRAIGFLLTRHMEGGRRLLRVSRNGHAHTDAFLDDHAYLLNGLMDLIDSTTPTSLPGTMARKRALELADTLIADFEDKQHGGFFFTGPRHEQLFARMKNAADNATPSANGVAIRALLRLARVSGKEIYRDVAMRAVAAFAANIRRRPDYFPTILLALVEERDRAHGTPPILAAPAIPLQPLAHVHDKPAAFQIAIIDGGPVKAGEPFEVRIRVTVAPGYHLQSHEPTDREMFRTVARLRGEVALMSQEWEYPPTQKFNDSSAATGFAGTVDLVARCIAGPRTGPGNYHMRATLLAQPCSANACLPPERAGADFMLRIVP